MKLKPRIQTCNGYSYYFSIKFVYIFDKRDTLTVGSHMV